MAIAEHRELLSLTNEDVYKFTQQQFVTSYCSMYPELVEWEKSLGKDQSSVELYVNSRKIWEFRKLINAYIGILVQCVGSSHLPESLLLFSHCIGEIKDLLRNNQSLTTVDGLTWKSSLKTSLGEAYIFDFQPLSTEEIPSHLTNLANEVLSTVQKDILSAGEFHELRKLLRTFKARYLKLQELVSTDNPNPILLHYSSEIEKTYKCLNAICCDMGLILDNIIRNIYEQHTPQSNSEFLQIFNAQQIEISHELRGQIFNIFINKQNVAEV